MIVLITYVVCLFCTMSLAANRFCEPSTHNCSNETSDSYLYHLFIEDCHRFLVEETFLWSVWSWLVAHQAWILSILASLVVGLSGIIPLLIIPIQEGANLITGAAARTLRVLLSFAVGVLHDGVFLHLLPDAWAAAETPAPEYNHNRNFDPGVFWIDNGAPCVCGNSLCENTWFEESVAHQLVMHNLEESAFISRDEAKVSQLLHSGKKLCRVGEDNNNILIRATQWLSRYLFQYPPAHNFRGPRGETLLMMCDTAKKFEMLQAFGAEVNEISDDGDTILIHHIKYRLPKQVQKIVYFNSCMVESSQFEKEEMAEEIMKMFEVIVNSGVKLNATDKKGMTALQVMLQKFKPGYVFCPYHVFHPLPNGVGFSHFADACLLQNELASSFLSLLLEAGAEIPPPDQHGRTALMLAVLNPQNFDNIKTLIHRGVDVKAEDNAGKNAIYYLLASFAQHNIIDAIFGSHEFAIVDEIACYLLDSGCEMQGTELIMRERCHRRSWWIYWKNVVHYLIARRTSSLREREVVTSISSGRVNQASYRF